MRRTAGPVRLQDLPETALANVASYLCWPNSWREHGLWGLADATQFSNAINRRDWTKNLDDLAWKNFVRELDERYDTLPEQYDDSATDES